MQLVTLTAPDGHRERWGHENYLPRPALVVFIS